MSVTKDCAAARRWLSAFRDAEALDDHVARAHLERCPTCRAWAADLDAVMPRLRLRLTGSPDVVGPALARWREQALAGADRRAAAGRACLAIAGAAGLLLALLGFAGVPGFALEQGTHHGRELAVFEAALSLGFLLAARDPERYGRGLLPIAAVVATLTILPSVVELTAARIDPLLEVSHVPVFVGLVGLLLFTRGGRLTAPTRQRPA